MKLVTFDAAGTLINHRWDPAAIACEAAALHGLQIDAGAGAFAYSEVESRFREELVRLERIGDHSAINTLRQKQMAAWLEGVGADAGFAPVLLKTFKENAFGKNSYIWSLYDDVLPVLEALKATQTRVGIISNWDHTLHIVLESLGITKYFDFVLASLEFGIEKPDKRIFEEAMRRGDARASESVHVGDSEEDDFVGARNAGMLALYLDRNRAADIAAGRITTLAQFQEAIGCLC